MKNTTDGKNLKPRKMLSRITAIVFLACLLLLSTCLFFTTQSKFVTELGWHDGETGGSGGYGDITIGSKDNDIGYSANTPTTVKSQIDLINAVKSGYTYVQLDGGLKTPLMITGGMLQLIGDMTIDLNGCEIERNDTESILTIPDGKRLTIIDTAGGGGLYNPIGSVLNITGGELNVFGGVLESGPRPDEYYANLDDTAANQYKLGAVNLQKHPSLSVSDSATMPRFPVRDKSGKKYGNVYVDTPIMSADGKTTLIDADTYCYMMINGVMSDDVATFDMSEASYLYNYTAETGEDVAVFAYKDVIRKSDPQDKAVPHYAAVRMTSGTLRVNVTLSGGGSGSAAIRDGSFHSYFGTEPTSCVYQTGGTIDISTSGSFTTVNPYELPDNYGLLAKKSLGSCIISQGVIGSDNKVTGGTINITQLTSAQAYNGSIISMMGGTLSMQNTNLTKNISMSKTNSYQFRKDLREEDSSMPPEQRFRTDAAIFVNGGTCSLRHTKITLKQNIDNAMYGGNAPGDFEERVETNGVVTKMTCLTTFGVLSRGWAGNAGDLTLTGCDFEIHGSYSYGVFATRGDLVFNRHDDGTNAVFDIDNANNSYGIYAYNRANKKLDSTAKPVHITLNGITVNLGEQYTFNSSVGGLTSERRINNGLSYNTTESTYEKNAVVGIYLNSHDNPGGKIDVEGAIIHSTDMGIALYGGDLTFKGEGEIHAYNASAIGVREGNLIFGDTETGETRQRTNYTITGEINRLGDGVAKNADGKDITCNATEDEVHLAGTHAYEVSVPWQSVADKGDEIQEEDMVYYENTNCIRVIGGNFYSYDDLTVNFRGLYNDWQGLYETKDGDTVYFDNVVIKSFAVCCTKENESDIESNVEIRKANITNTVGGGVKVDGGNVILGSPDAINANDNTDIVVTTKGRTHLAGVKDEGDGSGGGVAYGKGMGNSGHLFSVADISASNLCGDVPYGSWKFYPNTSGGHAVVSRGGNITVYSGTYTAAYANGITASGKDAKIDVYGGIFQGNMEHDTVTDANGTHGVHYVSLWGSARYIGNTGPGSHFGMKIMSNATVNIYGGTFDGKNGGLFVRGNQTFGSAIVRIYEGTFGSDTVQDGISIYSMSKVYFGAYTESQLSGKTPENLIKVKAKAYSVAMNCIFTDKQTDIYVYYGTYTQKDTTRLSAALGYINADMTNINYFVLNYGKSVADTSATKPIIKLSNPPKNLYYGYDEYNNTDKTIYYYSVDSDNNHIDPLPKQQKTDKVKGYAHYQPAWV